MTQKPIGSVTLRTAEGEEELRFDRDDLYARSLAPVPCRRSAARAQPSATGEDGVWSLAAAEAALAVREVAGTVASIDPKLGAST